MLSWIQRRTHTFTCLWGTALLLTACAPAERIVTGAPDEVPAPQAPAGAFDLQASSVEGWAVRPARQPFSEALLGQLRVADGFRIDVFAQDLHNPRMMAVGTDGTVYVSEQKAGQVRALRDADGDGRAETDSVVASGLQDVHGLALHDGRLYMATVTELYAADVRGDGTLAPPERLLDDLPDGGQHPNRTIAFGPDGMLYLSVGSTCNNCEEPNPEHATLLRAAADGSDRTIYAQGLRNTIGFGWHPQTGQLWGMDHGSDMRGNDTPPEELNRIDEGRHYGWPFCYGTGEPDLLNTNTPEGFETKEAFCSTTEPIVLGYQAHAAPIGMVFYDGDQFPADFRGDAFVAMRGSWNRNPPVGYELVRLRFDEQGNPEGFEPFVSGWLTGTDEPAFFARPAGLALAADGALLMSDDTNGVIYRIAYGTE